TGRFGPVVLFMLLPVVLGRVVRLSRLDADIAPVARAAGHANGDGALRASRTRGRFLRLAILVTLAAACYPVAPALFVVCALAFVVAAPFARGIVPSARALAIAVLAACASVVLLFPWPLTYAMRHLDAASLGFAFHNDLSLGEVVRFQSGPSGAGWAMWGLIVAA